MTYSTGSTRRPDPRPLHDKQYMQHCVKNLISYVIDHGYEHPISPKILTNPTSRDFQYIFLFLVKRIDPAFEFQRRLEDEVPAVLKALYYPFTISKSALSAVGSPHTWPSLLGVLTWLMGLLKYGDAKTEQEVTTLSVSDSGAGSVISPEERRHRLFYNNMVEAYTQFLQGADVFPELDRQLCGHFEEEKTRRDAEITKLQADRDQLAATLHTLQTQPSPLQLALEHRASLETNIHKFQLLIPSLLEHQKSVQAKIREKETEIAKEEEELTGLMEERCLLEKTLDGQEAAGIDSERLGADRERLREALRKLSTHRAQAERDQREAEQVLNCAFEILEDNLQKYHSLVRKLETFGADCGTDAQSAVWELHLSQDGSQSSLSNADPSALSKRVEKDVLPRLMSFKEHANELVPSLQEESLAYQEKIDVVEERLIVLRNDLSVVESRKKNLEEEYQTKRTAMSDQLQSRSKAMLEKEGRMTKALNERRDKLVETEQEVKRLTARLYVLREELGKKRAALAAIAEREMEHARRHREGVQASLSSVDSYFHAEAKL